MSVATPSPAGAVPAPRSTGAGFPPLLLGAGMLLWGWQNQALLFALGMALVYEAAPLVRWRWRFSASDFNRLVDLTAVLFVATALYQFDARGVHGVYGVLSWVPALLYVLLLGQRYSERGRIGLSALFLSVRRALARGDILEERTIDFAYPYFGACLLSSMAGSVRGPWLLPALLALVCVGLALARSRHTRLPVWCAVLLLAVVVGYLGQVGVRSARAALEPVLMGLMRDYMASRRDPFRTQTAIGEIGRLKLSERVEMRVYPGEGEAVPTLLRQATYRIYSRGSWLAATQGVAPVRPTDGGFTWTLDGSRGETAPRSDGSAPDSRSVRITRYLPRGRGVLAVPRGTWQLRDLAIEGMEQHEFGALRIRRGPDLVNFTARYRDDRDRAPGPDDVDLRIPSRQAGLFSRLVDDLGLADVEPAERVRRLSAHFARNFGYTLDQRSTGVMGSALESFLYDTRAGHCEFFATSTVLALRAAGVPARYVVGYAVSEWSPWDDAFVVRRRHAHAWAIAWVDGGWVTVDTTPSNWVALEASSPPWWQTLHDALSSLAHRYSVWRWRIDEEEGPPWLLFAVAPLVVFLLWRLRGQRVDKDSNGPAAEPSAPPPGADSPFLEVVGTLAERGHGTLAGETLPQWLARLEREGVVGTDDHLAEALALHERLRFDPGASSHAARARLDEVCRQWRLAVDGTPLEAAKSA